MFDNLTKRLHTVFRNIAGYGKITEKNMSHALHEIRKALLEADVNYKIVKDFIESIRQKALGKGLYKKVTPTQMLIKIVHDELVEILGSKNSSLNLNAIPSVIMLMGLHGSGKTTTCAKLAKFLSENSKTPLLVALDIERPAAVNQLKVLGEKLSIPVFEPGSMQNVIKMCIRAKEKAIKDGQDVIILDTAGRWHVEKDLVDELAEVKRKIQPQETIFVVDSTTGQDAANIAREFNERIGLDGVILTKVDGDSRGGAALSVKAVTGCPIKFIGVGEHLKDLEEFYPDRIASRILGMGDIITLVEKIEKTVREEEKHKEDATRKKIKKHDINLEDFLKSIKQIRKIAPMADLLKMMPMGGVLGGSSGKADKELKRIEAIINSMTKEERKHPEILDGSRRKRIAAGSGTTPHDINILLSRFEKMKKSMKKTKDQFGPKGFQMPKGFKMPKGRFPFPPRF